LRRLPYVILVVCGVAAAQPAPDPAQPAQEPAKPADQPPSDPTPPVPVPAPTVTPPAPVVSPPARTEAAEEAMAPYEASSVTIGGYIQPQFRMRQDSPAQFDQDGFRFARARLILGGQTRAGNLELSAYVEAELQPTFALADAFVTASRKLPGQGRLTLDMGQMRVPISRQNLLSDSRLSFVDKAQLATIAPDRDLGARLGLVVPHLRWVRVVGGAFNGDGKNQVENINQSYLYAGRVEISPVGPNAPLAESAFGGHFVTAALSAGHNKLDQGTDRETVTYLGADLSFAWRGLSGAVEYLEVRHSFAGPGDPAMLPPSFHANGWAAQLAYLLPIKLAPLRQARLEVGFRVEEIDRNDAISIPVAGDPNQSVRETTGVLSYYLRMHSLKAQLAVSHFTEIEDRTVLGGDATYKNDQALLQVTCRLE
jgi:hypothetical protein